MGTNQTTARVAGLLYLIVVLTGMFNLLYLPSRFTVEGNVAATLDNIAAAPDLYGYGIAAGVVCYTAFLLLPFVLHALLGHVDRRVAVVMVAFAVVSVPISLVALGHKLDVLALLAADRFATIDGAQLRAQAAFALESYRSGMQISQVFWGLWLLPFGWLVFRSGLLPKVFGILLMAGCFGYLVNIIAGSLWDGYAQSTLASVVSIPSGLGEIGICLWLLVFGVRNRGRPALATEPT